MTIADLEDGTTPAVTLLRELVALPSVSGDEVACRDHLLAWFAKHDVSARAHGRNVIAVIEGRAPGAPDGRGLLLCTHTDVVPVGAGWTRDPWDAALEDGKVWGRGSNDAKSSVAAMAVAAVCVDRDALAGRLVLALVCDEETGGEGLEACKDDLPSFDASVVGEPTGLDVCPGQRGLLRAQIVVRGQACHASRPWEGTNAIEAAARDILAVQGLELEPGDGPYDELLGPATLQCTVIEGGTRPNVLPGECRLELDGRPTQHCDNERMLALLQAAVSGEVVVRSRRFVPVRTELTEDIVAVARAASPSDVVRGFGGVSDLYHVRHVPGVVLGPGTSKASHAPDEWVAVSQVNAAVSTYTKIAESYLAPAHTPHDVEQETQS